MGLHGRAMSITLREKQSTEDDKGKRDGRKRKEKNIKKGDS